MNKIPKGWEVKKLGEIFNIVRGGSPRPIKSYLTDDKNGINWIKIGDIETGSKYITHTKQKILASGLKKSRAVKAGDLLLTNSMSFGRPYISKINGAVHDGWLIFEPKIQISKDYVFYFFSSSDTYSKLSNLAVGSTVKNLQINFLENFEIPLPPLSEQKAIADKLDDSFAKIENAITNLINAKENLKLYKQSVLKSAFNGDLLPSTSPTQRKKVKFEDVLKYEQPTKYIVKSTKYNNDFKTPVLTAGKGFILGYTNETEGIFTNTPVIIFDDFTTSSQYVNFHFKVKSSAMKILRPADNVNLKFLFYKMQTIQHKSDTHKRYWISEYAKLEIPLPPLSEQNLIVAEIDRRFAIVDKTLNLIDKSIQNAKNLKQSILKKAFSGELRSEI